ncbi:hypothetical protein BZG36_01496 [Bifiguratus adelaidae]|uniref:Ion transport domain-containing protein n=1 Tax=Bifiguratus adelaidae TaxID=1938954 RepID=A0A261Y4U2_9FUNG|nr:hypothetical protein BZG36_01496 [Bifiguratus adelaidae]
MRRLLSTTSHVASKSSYPYLLARRITALHSYPSSRDQGARVHEPLTPFSLDVKYISRKFSTWTHPTSSECEILYFPFRGISRYPKPDRTQIAPSATDPMPSLLNRLSQSIRNQCVLPPEHRSIYLQILEMDDGELLRCGIFQNLHFEALNLYKWRAFAQWRFMLISAFRIMLYVSIWCISSSQVTSEPVAMRTVLSLALVISLVFIAHEFRQLLHDGLVRYWSLYNVLDRATYMLAIALCMQWMVTNNINSSFQSLNNNQALSNYDPEAAANPSIATNAVQLVQTWESVWFFVTGNYNNYVGAQAGLTNNVLAFVYLLTTAIVLMNVLIALMSDAVSKSNTAEDEQWRLQQSRIIAEIELYWMLPHERASLFKFPRDICYMVDTTKLEQEKERHPAMFPDDANATSSTSLADKLKAMDKKTLQNLQQVLSAILDD